MLEVLNACKTLGGRQILSAINLTVEPGEAVAIIGPSGSGKSSLLRLLSFLEPPTSGLVRIDGQRGEERGPWPRVMPVFQQLFLWPHLTVEQNVTLAVAAQGQGRRKKVRELVNYFGLLEKLARYPNELSLGEAQRVALIRALILDPEYLLLDEVTSALDIEQIERVAKELERRKRGGTCVVFVTHLLGFARRLADRILFLDDGQIVDEGGQELLERPKNARVERFVALL